MRLGVAVGLTGLILAGCGATTSHPVEIPPPSYDEVLDECGLRRGDAVVGSDGTTIPVSEGCAWMLGRALQLDWVAFDAEPAAFDQPSTIVELVLAGMLVLLAPDAPVVSGYDTHGLPSELAEELAHQVDIEDLAEDETQGALWYALVTDWSDSTRFDGDEGDALAYNSGGDVAMTDLYAEGYGPVAVAGVLWHEASHGFLHRHYWSETWPYGGYDEDIQGANGSQAWWLYHWLQGRAEVDEATRGEIEDRIEERCWMIFASEELDAFEPCAA